LGKFEGFRCVFRLATRFKAIRQEGGCEHFQDQCVVVYSQNSLANSPLPEITFDFQKPFLRLALRPLAAV
jgi:hypothetical protein